MQAQKILIVQLMHHGDVLLSTAVIAALKADNPEHQIDMLVYKGTHDILCDIPEINNIFTIDRQWKTLGLLTQARYEMALFKTIRAQRYDIILNYSDRLRSGYLCALSGASKRLAYQWSKRSHWLWQHFHTTLIPPSDINTHIVEHNLLLVNALGIHTQNARPILSVSASTHTHLAQKLPPSSEPYILIHPGARWLFKCWDDDKMATVIQNLLNDGYHIVLTAAPDKREAAILQYITDTVQTTKGKLTVLNGNLTLRELAAAIANARLFIGVDSAPMHIAATLNVPTIALFGASHISRWRPYSDNATLIWAGDYGALPSIESINTDDPTRLLSAIPINAVMNAIHQNHKSTGLDKD